MAMTPDFQRLKELLAEALALPRAERVAFVERSCGSDDDGMRGELERLIKAHERAGGFLEQTAVLPEPDIHVEKCGCFIGRYKLLQEIGEGGFGRVFMAEQTEPVHRKVALKIVKAGMDTREVIARFEAERQALALMEHPNIARLLEAGVTGDSVPQPATLGHEPSPATRHSPPVTHLGRPYFVMELVNGIPLTDYCDRERLTTGERLQLFMQVCHAVQHAHQKGIIHRDLKPTNILVTVIDGQPVPKIIDFGIAKALGQRLTEKTLFTAFQQMIGTPAYMSPEQAELSGVDVDTRSDIYSLGVLLYELLTGVTPFDAETLRLAALDEVRRMIRETEPPKPSTRLRALGEKLTQVAQHRHTEPSTLTRLVHGDLDWIVMKALEKDRARRYETAASLVDDLRRHLEHEPVQAGPPRVAYRTCKFIRRHRVGVVMSVALVTVIVLGLMISLVAFWQARQQRDKARTAEAAAQEQRALAEKHAGEAVEQRNRAERLAAEGALERGQAKLEEGNSQGLFDLVQAMKLAAHDPQFQKVIAHRWSTWHGYWNRVTLAVQPAKWIFDSTFTRMSSVGDFPPLNTRSNIFVSNVFSPESVGPLRHESIVKGTAFTPDGKWLAAVTTQGFIHFWDLASGRPAREPVSTGITNLECIVISPRGRYLLAFSPSSSAVFLRLDDTKLNVRILPHAYPTCVAAFSPDEEILAIHNKPNLNLWRTADLQPVCPPLSTTFDPFLCLSPDGKQLAFAPKSAWLGLLDTATGKPTVILPKTGSHATSAQFSHDGRWLASVDSVGNLELRDVATGKLLYPACKMGGRVSTASFSPDDSQVAVSNSEGLVEVYQTSNSKRLLRLNHARYTRVCFHTNGVLVGWGEGLASFWNTKATPLPFQDLPHDALVHSVAFDDTGRTLATGSEGELRLWAMGDKPRLAHVVPLTGICAALAFSEGEKEFWVFTRDGTLTRVSSLTGGVQTITNLGRGYGLNAAVSPDGSYVAFWRYVERFIVCVPTGQSRPHDGNLSACFSRNGQYLVTGSAGWKVVRYELDPELKLPAHEAGKVLGWAEQVAIHPENHLVAVHVGSSGLRLYDADKQMPLQSYQTGALANVNALGFSADGFLLAAAGQAAEGGSAVELWNVDPARGLFPSGLVLPHPQPVECLAFSPDHQLLAVGGAGITRVWRLPLVPVTAEEAEVLTFDTLGFQKADEAHRVQNVIPKPNWDKAPAKLDRVFHSHAREIPELERTLALPSKQRLAALERLAADHPEVHAYAAILAQHHVVLAENLAGKAAWAEALAHYEAAAKLALPDPTLYYQRALLHLALNDETGYQRTCRACVDQFPATLDPDVIQMVAWSVSLVPGALDNYDNLLARMRVAEQAAGPHRDIYLAALLCRAGQYPEALDELEHVGRNLKAEGGYVDYLPVYRDLLQGITRARFGDKAAAAEWQERARIHLASLAAEGKPIGKWNQALTVQLLQTELEQLLKPSDPQ
jgi:serine/threonine protein kinase/WD40 repeat protein